jgi:hypothetical protein
MVLRETASFEVIARTVEPAVTTEIGEVRHAVRHGSV